MPGRTIDTAAGGAKEARPAKRKTGRPTRDQASRLTETILHVAMELFLKKGYSATSVEAIVERAHISKATFYSRFPSKSEVLEAAIDALTSRFAPINSLAEDDDRPFAERLYAIGALLMDTAQLPEGIALERLTMAESARFPRLAQAVHEHGTRHVEDSLVRFFEDAHCKGEIGKADFQLLAEHYTDTILMFSRRTAHGIGSRALEGDRHMRLRAITVMLCKSLKSDVV
ncbi:TetR/AcrR family transcriptional regulator [Novosphingobium lentum]|uniref:TetR/AcrR family transcriptional regulator n=1 Tax=Novosphingobium lentum TaxID=145287 RepID=UPI00082EF69C|nr:TetR/AcrR family transcriptional regulator [Novosphingobium lentum]